MTSFLKHSICLVLTVLVCQFSKAQYPSDISTVTYFQQDDLNIMLAIEKIDSNRYQLSWDQPFEKINKLKPGQEYSYLQCFVFDSNGIAGNNVFGLEDNDTGCTFKSKNPFVRLVFQKRKKVHRLKVEPKPKKSSNLVVVSATQLIQEMVFQCDFSEFNPIKVSVERSIPKEITLVNNSNIVALTFISKNALNPDPMPRFGCSFSQVFHYNRYYMNTETGKILSGKRWINRKSIRKLCDQEFQLIIPFHKYQDIHGNYIYGHKLIKRKSVDLSNFKRRTLLMVEFPY